MLTPPLKWHGGKHYLAPKIVALMPPHVHYVEPYAGGLAVLLAKNPEGVSEVVNDLNKDLIQFWRTLAHPRDFEQFRRFCEATPFAEGVWNDAGDILSGESARSGDTSQFVLRSWAFFIRCRQSLAGRMASFAPLSRSRTRRGMNEQAAAWLSAVEGLPAVHARLKRVVVLNRDALDAIRSQDGPDTLFYCDPPYLHQTRAAPEVYGHEMTEQHHRDLLDVLRGCKGKVMLSGYRSELYGERLAGWNRHDFDLPNNAAGGDDKRRMTECVWCTF